MLARRHPDLIVCGIDNPRIGKEIVIAVRAGGPEPAANPMLRRVIQNARAVNMPKDKVESAIRRAVLRSWLITR